MNAKEEFMMKQLAERCNNALTDNALLVIEVNDLRVELSACYSEASQLRAELRKALGLGESDMIEGLEPLEVQEPKLVESIPSPTVRHIPITTSDDEPKRRVRKKKVDGT